MHSQGQVWFAPQQHSPEKINTKSPLLKKSSTLIFTWHIVYSHKNALAKDLWFFLLSPKGLVSFDYFQNALGQSREDNELTR